MTPSTTPLRQWWAEFVQTDHRELTAAVADGSAFKDAERSSLRKTLRKLLQAAARGAPDGVPWTTLAELLEDAKVARAWKQSPTVPFIERPEFQALISVRDRFASAELALPDNDSYRNYADVRRPYVVRNVFAAPELELEPRRWCFPIAGCLSYRGYFDAEAAQRLADELRADGEDVYVADISAYSTLGWFADPLLNTFIHWPTARLLSLIHI